MSAGKNVLIVYAHQEPKSFNGALKDLAEKTLTAQGHTVKVSDLYAMNFDPRAMKEDFKPENLKNPDHFVYDLELSHAAKTGTLKPDARDEVAKLTWADLVILQAPVYWMGLPAILKGWIDRCLPETVAFDRATFQLFDKGLFKDKKLLVSITTGGGEAFYTDRGLGGDINIALWPIIFGLWNTGIQPLPVQVSYSPAASLELRKGYLETFEARLKTIFQEKPIQFVSLQHFAGESLSPEYLKSIEKDECGPTVGQHMGRPIKPDSLVYKKNT